MAVRDRNNQMEACFQAYNDQVTRINQMKAHFQAYKNCTSTHVVLADMPRELRQWLTSDPMEQ